MLCSNLGNEKFDAGQIKYSCGPQVPTSVLRYRVMRRVTCLTHTSEIKNLLNSYFIWLSLINFMIFICVKKTDYVSVIFRTGSRATHVVRVGNHVYAGTRLVTLVQTVLNNICLEDPL